MVDGGVRLEAAFRATDGPRFVPYVMGGFPTLEASRRHAAILAEHAGVLELGVPYSDPLADGPTIQAAGQVALRGGTRPGDVLEIAESLRGGPPIALMTYVNTLLRPGLERTLGRIARAGVAGLIVPDLPADEAAPLRRAAGEHGLALVALAAPTSTPARLAEIGRDAAGFVYAVSATGVTGGEVAVDAHLRAFLERLRASVRHPIAVGFGIRGPEQAAAVGALADGVVVASHIIRLVEGAGDPGAAEEAVAGYARAVAAALAGVRRPAA